MVTAQRKKEITDGWRKQHNEELAALGFNGNYKKLEQLEKKAHRFSTRSCNEWIEPEEKEAIVEGILAEVNSMFSEPVKGLFLNQDCRGYALKIDDKVNTLRQRDFGGFVHSIRCVYGINKEESIEIYRYLENKEIARNG